MGAQPEFDFTPSPHADGEGLARWQQQRERGSHRLARRLGLPLDHEVEVWLKDGVRLRGPLRLKDAMLFLETVDEHNLELSVGRTDFRYAEIESCVRMD